MSLFLEELMIYIPPNKHQMISCPIPDRFIYIPKQELDEANKINKCDYKIIKKKWKNDLRKQDINTKINQQI